MNGISINIIEQVGKLAFANMEHVLENAVSISQAGEVEEMEVNGLAFLELSGVSARGTEWTQVVAIVTTPAGNIFKVTNAKAQTELKTHGLVAYKVDHKEFTNKYKQDIKYVVIYKA